MSTGHTRTVFLCLQVAKRERHSQERDAASSPVQPEFWMRSATFAMLVVLWPCSSLQGFERRKQWGGTLKLAAL